MDTDRQARVSRPVWVAALLAGVAVVAVVLVLVMKDRGAPAPGTLEAEQVVRDYVAALNANDRGRLAELRAEPTDSAAISDHLDVYGGRGFTDVAVVLGDQIGDTYSWRVAATEDGEPVALIVVTEWAGDHWSVTVDS